MDIFSRLTALFLTSILLLTAACASKPAEGSEIDGSAAIKTVVSFDALFELAVMIGGDRASVSNIMPPGADAHHFEPRVRDLALLSTADVFIVCGLGFEPWAESAVSAAANDGLIICTVSRGIEPIIPSDEDEAHDPSHHDHDDREEMYDPHIWLSPSCAIIMAENIAGAFIEADPEGEELYRSNLAGFSSRLSGLIAEYSGKFGLLENRTLVTGHAVFAYLCRDFGLIQNSVEGVFSEGEPSARALAELVDFCRENNITSILAENRANTLVAQTLAAESGAVVRTIYTLESAEDGLTYLERMEHNLAVICESLT